MANIELETDYNKDIDNLSGHEIAYSIEARYNNPQPKQVCGILLSDKWVKLNFPADLDGIPSLRHLKFSKDFGVFGYSQAQALRWKFHAIVESKLGAESFGLETRLVKHKIEYNVKVTAISQHDVESDQSMVPSWFNDLHVILNPTVDLSK